MSPRPDSRERREAAMDDLRATSESIQADVHKLEGIEQTKQDLSPGDQDLTRLSSEAVELAERIQRQAKAERQIATEVD